MLLGSSHRGCSQGGHGLPITLHATVSSGEGGLALWGGSAISAPPPTQGTPEGWMQEQETATGSGLFCLGRVVLRVAGATLSRAEGGPEGQLRPMAGEAGGMQPLECGEARPRPGGSCGRPGQDAPATQGGRHRTVTGPRLQGRGSRPHGHPGMWSTGSFDTEHETQAHDSVQVSTWISGHRVIGLRDT
jgi:hypothetical protein